MRTKTFLRYSIHTYVGLILLTLLPVAKGGDLALDIVATPGQPQEGESTLFPEHVFYVVLTNTSEKTIRIFEDWSSWGMFSLSFEGKTADGTVIKFERSSPDTFTRNFPAVFEIQPQRHYVFAVRFDKDKWPVLWWVRDKSDTKRFLFKAVFTEVDKDGKNNVWQGTVESEARWVSIF